MKVVITDCDFGDGTLEAERLGEGVDVVVAGTRDPDEIVAAAADADGLLVQWARIDDALLARLPRLKGIVRYGIGLDNIDLVAAAERGVAVSNVDDYCLDEVADHAAAMIIARSRRLWEFDRAVKRGEWTPRAASTPPPPPHARVGIAGFGRIGRGVADRVAALGHPVLFWDPFAPSETTGAVRVDSLVELAHRVDHLSLHVPLTDDTRGIVDASVLQALGPTGHLVNTSRGPLIDETALLDALDRGHLGAASLDVLTTEPPAEGTVPARLAQHPRVLCTPHMAYLSTTSLARLRSRAAELIAGMLA